MNLKQYREQKYGKRSTSDTMGGPFKGRKTKWGSSQAKRKPKYLSRKKIGGKWVYKYPKAK